MNAFSILNLAACTLIIPMSCSHATEGTENNYPSSFEFNPHGDTVNRLDHKGKQGIWVPSISNKLKDTTYYHNDTIVE